MEERTLVPVALTYLRRTPAIPVLLVVVAAGAIAFGDTFLTARNFASMAVASSFLLIIAVGMTLVIISGGIDLSVGSMLALGAVLTAYAARWGSVAAIGVPLAVCTLIGLTQGLLIGRSRMPPFIVTLAGLLFARGLAFKVSDNGNTTHLIPDDEWVTALGQSTFLGVGLPAWFALVVLLAGMILLYRSRFGFSTYAIGGSEEAALLMGVRVVRVKVALYTLMGFLCGVSGLLVAARSSSGLSTIGAGLELKAIAAVVIGGTLLTGGYGGLTGTLAGVLLLGVIENLINQIGTLSSYYQLVASGAFLIAVVSAQSLFAKRELRRSGEVA
jgi:ribose/xylose/arabinose/galactoside ABC-type transport system permease subunit